MTNSKTFFVEIKPVGYYFFGGEQTFQTIEKDKFGKDITNYYAVSNPYPQQTALLGMLRHTMLVLYDQLNVTPSEKEATIGKNFSPLSDEPFGIIGSVSPLVIYKNSENSFLLPAGYDRQIYNDFGSFSYESRDGEAYINKKTEKVPKVGDFNYKEELSDAWYDGSTYYTENDIFKTIIKVGVDIKADTEGFYKQKMYGLLKDFSFGVWVTFTEDLQDEKLVEILMPFGADQGMVRIKFHKDKNMPVEFTSEANDKSNKLVLTSDAFIEDSFFDAFDHGITKFTDFRFIKSAFRNFYKMDESGFSKSNKTNLLKRGSVLYFSDHKKVSDALLNLNKSFKRIGYNYFKFN